MCVWGRGGGEEDGSPTEGAAGPWGWGLDVVLTDGKNLEKVKLQICQLKSDNLPAGVAHWLSVNL